MISVNVPKGLSEIPETLIDFERDKTEQLEKFLLFFWLVLPILVVISHETTLRV